MTFIHLNGWCWYCMKCIVFSECAWFASAGGIAPRFLVGCWCTWIHRITLGLLSGDQVSSCCEQNRQGGRSVRCRPGRFFLALLLAVLKKDMTGMNDRTNEMEWNEIEWNVWNLMTSTKIKRIDLNDFFWWTHQWTNSGIQNMQKRNDYWIMEWTKSRIDEGTIEWMHQSLSRSLTSDLDVRHRARSCLGRGCQETGNFPRGACFFFLRQRGSMILVEYWTGCKQVRLAVFINVNMYICFLIIIQVYARVVRSKEEPWNPTRTFKYSTSSCAVSIRRYSHSKLKTEIIPNPRMVGAAEAAPKASEANQGEITAVVHKRIIF